MSKLVKIVFYSIYSFQICSIDTKFKKKLRKIKLSNFKDTINPLQLFVENANFPIKTTSN